jgi:hypothetical protein
MNKRIKEIADQCNFTEQDIIDMSPGFEKFAELIIRECQSRIELYIRECGEIGCLPEYVLNRHFGVKL